MEFRTQNAEFRIEKRLTAPRSPATSPRHATRYTLPTRQCFEYSCTSAMASIFVWWIVPGAWTGGE